MKSYLSTCSVLGVNVAVTDMKKSIEFLTVNLESNRGQYVCVSNSHTVVTACDNPSYMDVQNSACMVLPDGKPLSVVQRIKGCKGACKVSGPDIMFELVSGKYNQYKHFFYGATNNTLDSLKANLIAVNPGLQIVGMYSPPFRPLTNDEDCQIVNLINNSNADFVWVGLGAPKQEIWMRNHSLNIDDANPRVINALMLGVGAAFDFHAGTIKRAPLWMQKCGLEWLYRLTQDPKRLFKRYFVTNTKFILYNLLGK